jgi:predicted dehydrogenase
MKAPARVGIVGCGVISRAYVANAPAFDTFEIVACADLERTRCDALAAEHALEALSVGDLLASPSIDVVLNLTPPLAHVAVTRAALEAGKHVYSEKPLAITAGEAADLVRFANAQGRRLGCAPDIFLGRAYQTARALLDEGAIGEPLAASAAMVGGGQERWHPDPDTFFRNGGGPLLDMGPYYLTAIVALLGPVRRVTGFASTLVTERRIEIGPRTGEVFAAETPTHTAALLELAGGLTATLVATFEAPGHYSTMLLVHGSEGELALPDPNAFEGPVQIRRSRGGWEDVAYARAGARDARGLGLHDLVAAIAANRPPRASAELAAHVVDVATSILASGERSSVVAIESETRRPDALPLDDGVQVEQAAER